MKKEIMFNIPTDEDGFLEYECPFCMKIFRLSEYLFKTGATVFCPYCGLNSSVESFYTTKSNEYCEELAKYEMEKMVHEQFSKLGKKSSIIKIKTQKPKNIELDEVGLCEDITETKRCDSCEKSYKVTHGNAILYCPYCGDIS